MALHGAGRAGSGRLQARGARAAHRSAGGRRAERRGADGQIASTAVCPRVFVAQGSPYENNAYQLGQGKRLYDWFNCKGCHANGGGASGPALIDGWWRYGPDPVSIFLSIRDGRPHGMPAFATG